MPRLGPSGPRNGSAQAFIGHFAGAAPLYEGPRTGMSAPIATGLLPRLAGADLALVVSPYGGYPISRLQYLRTAHQLALRERTVRMLGIDLGVVAAAEFDGIET